MLVIMKRAGNKLNFSVSFPLSLYLNKWADFTVGWPHVEWFCQNLIKF